jgi:hypothetical protein
MENVINPIACSSFPHSGMATSQQLKKYSFERSRTRGTFISTQTYRIRPEPTLSCSGKNDLQLP